MISSDVPTGILYGRHARLTDHVPGTENTSTTAIGTIAGQTPDFVDGKGVGGRGITRILWQVWQVACRAARLQL